MRCCVATCAGERGQRGRRLGRVSGRAAVAALRAAAARRAQARRVAASVRAQARLARQSNAFHLLHAHDVYKRQKIMWRLFTSMYVVGVQRVNYSSVDGLTNTT